MGPRHRKTATAAEKFCSVFPGAAPEGQDGPILMRDLRVVGRTGEGKMSLS